MSNQTAKRDAGKLPLTLVPLEILEAIAVVREYGNRKYGDPDNWKTVEKDRYKSAMFRHFVAYLREPYGMDAESRLPHLYHVACNVAFLIALEMGDGTIPDATSELGKLAAPKEETTRCCITCKYAKRALTSDPCIVCSIGHDKWEKLDGITD